MVGDQHVASAETFGQDARDSVGLPVGEGDFQYLAAEIQHGSGRQRHSRLAQLRPRIFQAGFQSLLLCYQSRDEHCLFS